MLRLDTLPDGFRTEVFDGKHWCSASELSVPVYRLRQNDSYTWKTDIYPAADGYWIETTLIVSQTISLNPSMILWLGTLDNLDDRQAHTWRQTVLRAPTTNQQGLSGNDLPACYLYDDVKRVETVCYFPPEAFTWAPQRFYDFTMREIIAYRPDPRYGLGLIPNSPETEFQFEPGVHQFKWWFTQRYRETTPDVWQAQRTLIDCVTPLLDPIPTLPANYIGWHEMASNTLKNLDDVSCWITINGQTGLRAYVRGSSVVGRDEAQGFELMTQLDVLWPLLLWQKLTGSTEANPIIENLLTTIPEFHRPQWNYVTNHYPPHANDSFMDTWYFLENALIKLPWVAHLANDEKLKTMFFDAMEGARKLAHNTNYLFPLFADASDWKPRNSLLNVGVAGLYAAGCVMAYQLSQYDESYLKEAAQALRTMMQLPPHQLTHEPQQLTFAAAVARFLAQHNRDNSMDWYQVADSLVRLSLRMGYWGKDQVMNFYDQRGMFQACASLCYPAFKENVETLLAFPELLRENIGSRSLMLDFLNLQRCHNYAFFDPYLPEEMRRGPCPYIPYEDLATTEFRHTATLGKELYGAGEVFWSALLFDTMGRVDNPHILCLFLDMPCLEIHLSTKRFLIYNPTDQEVRTRFTPGEIMLSLPAKSVQIIERGA